MKTHLGMVVLIGATLAAAAGVGVMSCSGGTQRVQNGVHNLESCAPDDAAMIIAASQAIVADVEAARAKHDAGAVVDVLRQLTAIHDAYQRCKASAHPLPPVDAGQPADAPPPAAGVSAVSCDTLRGMPNHNTMCSCSECVIASTQTALPPPQGGSVDAPLPNTIRHEGVVLMQRDASVSMYSHDGEAWTADKDRAAIVATRGSVAADTAEAVRRVLALPPAELWRALHDIGREMGRPGAVGAVAAQRNLRFTLAAGGEMDIASGDTALCHAIEVVRWMLAGHTLAV